MHYIYVWLGPDSHSIGKLNQNRKNTTVSVDSVRYFTIQIGTHLEIHMINLLLKFLQHRTSDYLTCRQFLISGGNDYSQNATLYGNAYSWNRTTHTHGIECCCQASILWYFFLNFKYKAYLNSIYGVVNVNKRSSFSYIHAL